jgi:putative salt-induced outer membrane protein
MPAFRNHRTSLAAWRWLAILLWVWCLGIIPCSAQEAVLHLRNGDRVTGTIVSTNTNEVVVRTAFAGQITVSAAQIARRDDLPLTAGALQPAGKPPPAQVPPASSSSPMPVAAKPALPTSPVAAKPPPKAIQAKTNQLGDVRKFIADWKGEAELGLNLGFSSKDRQTYAGRLRASHLHTTRNQKLMKNDLDYLAAYGRTDGVLSDNRMDGSWKLDYSIQKRFSVYNATGAGYDEVRKIDLRFDVGPGFGYKWLNRTNFVLMTELGGNYQEQMLRNQGSRHRHSLRLAEESWWQVASKIRWDEKIEFFPEIDHFGDFRVRAESNLSYLFHNSFSLKLTVIDLYETNPAKDVSQNDLQIRSSLSFKF